MAVIEPTPDGLLLREPGVSVADIVANADARLQINGQVPEMPIGASEGLAARIKVVRKGAGHAECLASKTSGVAYIV